MDKFGWIDGIATTSLLEYLINSILDFILSPIRFLQGLFAGPNGVSVGDI